MGQRRTEARPTGRAVIFLALLALLPTVPAETPLGHKLVGLGRGLVQMALSTEGHSARHLIDSEPDPSLLEGWKTEARTVVFVRHGQSTWNEIFNQGKGIHRFLWMPLRLARGLAREAASLLLPESIFIDSPLSNTGIQQAVALREAFQAAGDDNALLAEALAAPSVIVSSNLVRAVETITLALTDRLAETGEKIFIRSELQEISRNIDAVALAPPLSCPPSPRAAVIEAQDGADVNFDTLYCADGNRGNKAVRVHPKHRLTRFAAFCFGDEQVGGLDGLRKDGARVIVAGHSLWFKTFFRMFVDKGTPHLAKEKKISNSGVVTFTLERGLVGGRMLYRIRPDDIRLVYGKFE